MKHAAWLALGLVLAASWAVPAARAAQIYRYDPGASTAQMAPAHATEPGHAKPHTPSGPRRAPDGPSAPSGPGRAPDGPSAPSGPGRAPDGPPLVSGPADEATPSTESSAMLMGADASSSAPASGGDPLVDNGLGSPLCGSGLGDLSAQSRLNCATSGFEASGAPTGDYGLDVHIDTGALGFTVATLEQDYLIGPVWMGLVWVTHTLVVALEWCFTLDLLGGSAMVEIERALRGTQASFTRPLLAFALALAAVAAAYDGLVRRRVAETLGQAALMLAMTAGGLWVIANPAGTVGSLGRWADAASLGTLGTLVEGSPAHARRALADSMSGLFGGVVDDPWCYLEFGAVRWCDEPGLLDRRLRAAALRIASAAQPAGCDGGSAAAADCEVLEGEQPAARAQSARLLRAARTNGELFLALPADEAARNSINDSASLLRALCGGSTDATDCRGPTAPQAEYRTQSGTEPRIGGLLLIVLGSLGMLLLLGYIALHLLGSELLALLYLLLAPAATLAPALGDGGRAAFRTWSGGLVGAVISKLLFSFLLGVVLLLTRTLLELSAFGWWTRWLLVSTTWWGAYLQRRRLLGLVQGELRATRGHSIREGARRTADDVPLGHAGRRGSVIWRAQRRIESPLGVARAVQWARGRLDEPADEVEPRRIPDYASGAKALGVSRMQAMQMLQREYGRAREELAEASRVRAEVGERREQLRRLRAAREQGHDTGDTRRVALLGVRVRRVEGELTERERRLSAARRRVAEGEAVRRLTGMPYTRGEVKRRERFLDEQAALPSSARRARGRHRDYAALASLAGYGREQYERLDPRYRRETRLRVDRELAARGQSGWQSQLGHRQTEPYTPPRQSATPPRQSAPGGASSLDRRPAGELSSAIRASRESAVMRDAREVAAGRKRELGFDRD
jgi:hypothetical protein